MNEKIVKEDYLMKLYKTEQKFDLKNEKISQHLFTKWKRFDNVVAFLTLSGLLIAFIYHYLDYYALIKECDDATKSERKCKELIWDFRYEQINIRMYKIIIFVLSILSAIIFCIG